MITTNGDMRRWAGESQPTYASLMVRVQSQNKVMKLDQYSMQDLHHYCLAMIGRPVDHQESTFAHSTLLARLDAAENAYDLLTTLETEDQNWCDLAVRAEVIRSEAELVSVATNYLSYVNKWAKANNVDTYCGKKIQRQEVA